MCTNLLPGWWCQPRSAKSLAKRSCRACGIFCAPLDFQIKSLYLLGTVASCVLLHDPTLAPSSTEAPSTSMRQTGEVCHALYTEAFTSFCHAYDRARCSDPPGHHCLLPPHVAEDCTVFSSFFCARLPSRLFSRCFPSSWPSTPVFRCHRETFPTLEPGTCAARYLSFVFPFLYSWTAKCLTDFWQHAKLFYSKVADSSVLFSSTTLFLLSGANLMHSVSFGRPSCIRDTPGYAQT